MPNKIDSFNHKPIRYRFHPIVRIIMLTLASVTAVYTMYFMFYLIPHFGSVSYFIKVVSVIVLYVSLNTIYKHLTSLNAVIIRPESLELRFLIRKWIVIPWEKLFKMEIYKVITHYWKITYLDNKGKEKIFKTSLAFPGMMEILLKIQDHKPDVNMNELLSQVLIYKRKLQAEETKPE